MMLDEWPTSNFLAEKMNFKDCKRTFTLELDELRKRLDKTLIQD